METLALDKVSPNIIYAGTFNAGALRSPDGGQTWETMDNGLPGNVSVQHFAVAPTLPTLLYAGVRDQYKIYRSDNGGASWQAMTPPYVYWVDAIAVNPVIPTIVYAGIGIVDTPYGGHVVRSTDGGNTWTQILPYYTVARSIVVDPQNHQILYVGRAFQGGMLKSYDGGNSWQPINNGLTGNELTIYQIVLDPNNPQMLFIVTGGGLFGSVDGGENWSNISAALPTSIVSAADYAPGTPGVLFVSSVAGGVSSAIYSSSDYGNTWSKVSDVPNNLYIEKLAVVTISPLSLYVVGNNTIWRLSAVSD
ncbi:MAG: hypothetical protein L0332_16355 [Chloroflexi bacterium]|nr:hypothetical protein [Chloroflexota bacterium]MCI0728272.1 hypothetical protein [Chloroflexota bacterium]